VTRAREPWEFPRGHVLRTGGGKSVRVDERIARGGQGAVYALAGDRTRVLKQIKPEALAKDLALQRRVSAMIAGRPASWREPTSGHVLLAWPLDVAFEGGRFVGFLMPRVDSRAMVELHVVANPSDRRRRDPGTPVWVGAFTWQYLLGTATNLAFAVQALHTPEPYVIGDFNERNVLVDEHARVTLVDCDSMQVPDPHGGAFLCTVGRPEYTAPELLRADLRTTVRAPSSDLFALAVHVHQLLLEGVHPFDGRWRGPGDKPPRSALALEGLWAYAGDPRLAPPPLTIGVDLLPRELRALFRRAFVSGAKDPAVRPAASEWQRALLATGETLATCSVRPQHRYPGHHASCPWCAHERSVARALARRRSAPAAAAGMPPGGGAALGPQPWAAAAGPQPQIPLPSPIPAGGPRATGGWAGPPPPRAQLPTRSGRARRIVGWAVAAAVAIGGIVAATQGSGSSGTQTPAPAGGSGGVQSAPPTHHRRAARQPAGSNGGTRRSTPAAQSPRRTRSGGQQRGTHASAGGSGGSAHAQTPAGGGSSGGGATSGLQGSSGGGSSSGSGSGGGATSGLQGSSGGGSSGGGATSGLQGSSGGGGGGLQGSAGP
jgi:hypothetical protein